MNLQIFKNDHFGSLNVLILENEFYFNLNEVGELLNIANPRTSIDVTDSDYVRKFENSIVGETYNRKLHNTGELFLTEAGLYRLLNRSNKPEAEVFQKWVNKEVLPSIRKTGSYSVQSQIPQTFAEALKLAYEQQLVIEQQEKKIQVLKPKGEYFDALVDRNLLTNFRDTTKELGVKQNDFIRFLETQGYVYRDTQNKLKPYSQHMEYFEIKEWKNGDNVGVQTLITPRGREAFRLLLNRCLIVASVSENIK